MQRQLRQLYEARLTGYFILGAPGMITKNFDKSVGAVNGATGIYLGLTLANKRSTDEFTAEYNRLMKEMEDDLNKEVQFIHLGAAPKSITFQLDRGGAIVDVGTERWDAKFNLGQHEAVHQRGREHEERSRTDDAQARGVERPLPAPKMNHLSNANGLNQACPDLSRQPAREASACGRRSFDEVLWLSLGALAIS